MVQTFSKSRSLAGIRLGVAYGSAEAISHLYDVKIHLIPIQLIVWHKLLEKQV